MAKFNVKENYLKLLPKYVSHRGTSLLGFEVPLFYTPISDMLDRRTLIDFVATNPAKLKLFSKLFPVSMTIPDNGKSETYFFARPLVSDDGAWWLDFQVAIINDDDVEFDLKRALLEDVVIHGVDYSYRGSNGGTADTLA